VLLSILYRARMGKLKLAFIETASPPRTHELSKTYLVLLNQFRIRTRRTHGWIQKFSDAAISRTFRITQHYGNTTT
jgi:hypothetical protein